LLEGDMRRRARESASMFRCVSIIPTMVWVGVVLGELLPACGEEWMFRRSYFSHALPPGVEPPYPLPESRSAYRPAYYREAAGWSVRSAYRVNNYVIQNGNRTDRTYYREGYIEFEPQ
jgi:hypothetical protein